MKKWSRIFIALAIMLFANPPAAFCTGAVHSTVAHPVKDVKQSEWYPSYHFASPSFLLQEPSGLVFFKDNYHLFFLHNPNSFEGNKSQQSHAVSPDLLHWKNLPKAISPSTSYDNGGIFSGSAIVKDDLLHIFYTGLSEPLETAKETQNLAMSKDGINFGKSANNPVITEPPHYDYLQFSKKNFKHPFVWEKGDRYYALLGANYEKTNDGAVLLFKSKDLRNWVFINITALGQKGEMGQVWEYPNFVHIGNEDVLIFSTKGIKPQGKKFLNLHQSGWMIGSLDYNSGTFKQKSPFGLFDYGFDFFAPQTLKTTDGRTVLIGQLGMPESQMPEKSDKWAGMLALPRELKIINGKIYTTPIEELKKLRGEKISLANELIGIEKEFHNVKGNVYEIVTEIDLTNAKSFCLKLRTGELQETVLSYDKELKTLKLNRDKSGNAQNGVTGEREVLIPLVKQAASENSPAQEILKLRVFVDKSSIEVFANDGQAALSARIYPDKSSTGIKFSADGQVKLKSFDLYRLKSIHE